MQSNLRHLDCEDAAASGRQQAASSSLNRRKVGAIYCSVVAVGMVVGVMAFIAHGGTTGVNIASKAFVASAGSALRSNTAGMHVSPQMMAAKTRASPTKPVVGKKAKPLSPGSNYPSTKNIQTQRNGFGTWLQKFQTVDDKSKYGVPIYLPSGNVNPAYLAAERKEMMSKKKKNVMAAESKRKGLVAKKKFELADFIRKNIGNVGSNKEYYQSGK
jgi:hypothetical protein